MKSRRGSVFTWIAVLFVLAIIAAGVYIWITGTDISYFFEASTWILFVALLFLIFIVFYKFTDNTLLSLGIAFVASLIAVYVMNTMSFGLENLLNNFTVNEPIWYIVLIAVLIPVLVFLEYKFSFFNIILMAGGSVLIVLSIINFIGETFKVLSITVGIIFMLIGIINPLHRKQQNPNYKQNQKFEEGAKWARQKTKQGFRATNPRYWRMRREEARIREEAENENKRFDERKKAEAKVKEEVEKQKREEATKSKNKTDSKKESKILTQLKREWNRDKPKLKTISSLSKNEKRKLYLTLVRKYHPDKYNSNGSRELNSYLTKIMQEINSTFGK